MGDLWRSAIGAGLHDGFNPCILMTCAVFILHGTWIQKSSSHLGLLRLFFVLIYVLCSLFFNFGPAGTFLSQKFFMLTAKIIYFGLGICAFVLGVLFLKEWFIMRHRPQEDLTGKKTGLPVGMMRASLITLILGVVLSLLSTLWPVNFYIMLWGLGIAVNAQWYSVLLLLLFYTIMGMWPLWFLWSFLSIKNLRPTLLKIVCASVFLAATSCTILIFK